MDGDYSSGTHLDEPICQRDGVLPVVRDVNRRYCGCSLQVTQLCPKNSAKLRVEARERLIQQQKLRTTDKRSCERDALLFTAGQFMRIPATQRLDPGERECFTSSLASFGLRNFGGLEDKLQMLLNRQVRP